MPRPKAGFPPQYLWPSGSFSFTPSHSWLRRLMGGGTWAYTPGSTCQFLHAPYPSADLPEENPF